MTRWKRLTLAAALAIAGPAEATMIDARGSFTVTYFGGDGAPIFDPPLEGAGFLNIQENRLVEFEFDMGGAHWTADDVEMRRCTFCSESSIFLIFVGAQGNGHLLWDFEQGFTFSLRAGTFDLIGDNLGGPTAHSAVTFAPESVPEPGSLPLALLGLLGLARRR